MLVLTRRLHESILIGDDIEIEIVQIRGAGGQPMVRVGISAPKHVTVLRKEVYEEVVAANQQALKPVPELPVELLQAVEGEVGQRVTAENARKRTPKP